MTNNWEKFKQNQNQQPPTGDRPVGRKINGNYRCQHCKLSVTEATYYPNDGVLKWVCADEHASFMENFNLAF